ncbi:hypothetical protein ACTXT7_011900, partial [Hymenolepis weldensis]
LFQDIGRSHFFTDIAGASHSPEPLRFPVVWTSFQCFKIWWGTRCICCVGVYEEDENDWKGVLPFEIYCPFDRDNKDTGISAVVAARTQFPMGVLNLVCQHFKIGKNEEEKNTRLTFLNCVFTHTRKTSQAHRLG